jgi:hypothetical protein
MIPRAPTDARSRPVLGGCLAAHRARLDAFAPLGSPTNEKGR